MSTFTAKYAGRCADCQGGISPGDEIIYVQDQAVHAEGDCGNEMRPLTASSTGVVCTVCWSEKSVTGACSCDPE